MTDVDLYKVSDIEERIFFISDAEDRLNIKLICNFAFSKKCNIFGELKNVIHEIEYPNIIEKINDGYFDETLRYIFTKRLWSSELETSSE